MNIIVKLKYFSLYAQKSEISQIRQLSVLILQFLSKVLTIYVIFKTGVLHIILYH